MVNSIFLKKKFDLVEGVKEGDIFLQILINYYKLFMKLMFKRGGIGVFQGRVVGKLVDVINIENVEEW